MNRSSIDENAIELRLRMRAKVCAPFSPIPLLALEHPLGAAPVVAGGTGALLEQTGALEQSK